MRLLSCHGPILLVVPLRVPPLRERKDDLPLLIEHFLSIYAKTDPAPKIDGKILGSLYNYNWPGNIRELQNVVERAVILSKGIIDIRHINIEISENEENGNDGLLKLTERETIERVLSDVGGNRKKAAQILGISLRTLQYRIKEFGLA